MPSVGRRAVTSVSMLCHVALKSWPRTQPVTVAWAPPEGGAADLRASQGPSAAGPSCNSNNFREEGKKKKSNYLLGRISPAFT